MGIMGWDGKLRVPQAKMVSQLHALPARDPANRWLKEPLPQSRSYTSNYKRTNLERKILNDNTTKSCNQSPIRREVSLYFRCLNCYYKPHCTFKLLSLLYQVVQKFYVFNLGVFPVVIFLFIELYKDFKLSTLMRYFQFLSCQLLCCR